MTGKVKLADGNLACSKCLKQAGYSTTSVKDVSTISKMDYNQIKKSTTLNNKTSQISSSKEIVSDAAVKKAIETPTEEPIFHATQSSNHFQVDEEKGLWKFNGKFNEPYSCNDLLNYELLTNGSVQTKGGVSIGRALVGNALLGPAGMILGGLTGKKKQVEKINRIEIKLRQKGTSSTTTTITIYKGKDITTDSKDYVKYMKIAENDLALLDTISQFNPEQLLSQAPQTVSATNEIRKYKELLDDGIITQEEFETKKKELLGL